MIAKNIDMVNRSPQGFSINLQRLNASEWGWLPILSLSGACALFLLAVADNAGRANLPWADLVFWIGLLVLFVPFAVRLLSATASRTERITLTTVLGMSLYLVKVLQYPMAFMYSDEFQHVRTAQDILSSGHLFLPNPLLAVSPSFPGLEIVVTAVSSLSGLSLFLAGVITLAVVRVILMLALFLLYERLSNSSRIAGIATLLFMATALFVFFESQFSYESLALPLLILILWAIVKRMELVGVSRSGLAIITCLSLMAITVTHHLASYQLIAFFFFWCIISIWVDRKRPDWISPWLFTVLGAIMVAFWAKFAVHNLEEYLGPYPSLLWHNIAQVIKGQSSVRPLFQQVGPQVVPTWERIVAFISAILLLLGMPPGLYYAWKHYRQHSFMVAMVITSLLYPLSLALRFTPTGENIGGRLAGYAFIPLALLVTLGGKQLLQWLQKLPADWNQRVNRRIVLTTLASSILAVVFTGGIVQGAGQIWTQVPGPYIVGAASGPSVDSEGVNAALWMQQQVGPGQRVTSDLTTQLLMGSYGRAWVVTGWLDKISIAPLFTSQDFGMYERGLINAGKIHYLVVDSRISTQLPALGYYFDRSENDGEPYVSPMNESSLRKFDSTYGVDRVFDSGSIAIYDVGLYINSDSESGNSAGGNG